jgi:hypothetical protein
VEHLAKWLAVRVVWWDMRPEWCELVYRHRVCNTRADFAVARLGDVSGGRAGWERVWADPWGRRGARAFAWCLGGSDAEY